MSASSLTAQTTKQWTVDRFDELERGTTEGVAIRSDGRLEAGPAVTPLATLDTTGSGHAYVWAVASDPAGAITYAGVGGSTAESAAVLRLAPGGAPETVFRAKALGVQALRCAADGTVFAAHLAGRQGLPPRHHSRL